MGVGGIQFLRWMRSKDIAWGEGIVAKDVVDLRSTVKTTGRFKLVWVVMGMLVATVVFAACGSDSDSGTGDEGAGVAPVADNPDAAPDFELELLGNVNNEKGTILRLSELRGKPTVVNFWYPSCPPCRLEMPDLEAASKKHKGDVEFVGVMSLILDTVDEGQDFIDEFGITYANGPDPENTIIDYGVIGFPTSVFLDKDHNVVRKWTGALNAEKLEELIEEALP